MTKSPIITLLSLLLLLLTACSDDDKDQTTAIAMPETQYLNVTTGDRPTLTFNAPADWRLTSSATWCRFVADDELEYSIAGTAGQQTVTLAISDEGLDYESMTTARLTLYINGQQATLAEVARAAAGYELTVIDADGNPLDEIKVGYADYETFRVKANFAFALTAMPDWAELQGGSLVGAAGQTTEGGLMLTANGEREMYAAQGTVTFQSLDGKAAFSVKATFDGMPADIISVTPPAGSPWNWSLNADATTWTHEGATYNDFITTKIVACDNLYDIVFVEKGEDGLTARTESWLRLDKATGRITADPTDTDRECYMLALPRATYQAVSGNLQDALIDADGAIAYTYQQQNMVLHVKQQASAPSSDTSDEVGFIALCFDDSWELIEIECRRITNNSLLEHCRAAIGTDNVFLLSQPSPSGHFDQVRPYPLLGDYSDLNPDNTYFTDYDGTRLFDEVPEPSFDDSSTPQYWYIMGCHNSADGRFLVLEDMTGNIIKALLIKTTE